jgi:hypothetical protein
MSKKKEKSAKTEIASDWDPNKTSFEKGRPYVELQLKKAGLDPDAGILTSKDPKARKALSLLKTLNAPRGFEKHQLPFSFFHPTNLYVASGKAGSTVPSHSHDEGAGMRFIIKGSLTINGKRLGPGDWIYIPKGKPYSLKVGPKGVQFVADYAC